MPLHTGLSLPYRNVHKAIIFIKMIYRSFPWIPFAKTQISKQKVFQWNFFLLKRIHLCAAISASFVLQITPIHVTRSTTTALDSEFAEFRRTCVYASENQIAQSAMAVSRGRQQFSKFFKKECAKRLISK